MIKKGKTNWIKYKTKVYEIISQNRYENGIGKIVGSLPTPDKVREEMEKHFKVSTKRNSIRIILVEDFGDYKIFLTNTRWTIKV